MHSRRKTLPPKLRDAAILIAITTVFVAVVRPALVTAQTTVNSQLCIGNVKQLSQAIIEYTQDYDEAVPVLTPAIKLKKEVQPYTSTNVAYLLTCPLTRLPYTLNTSVGGKYLTLLPSGTTVLATDSTPHLDGKLTVCFLNGTVTYGGVATTALLDPNAQCVGNAKQIGLALLEYAQDYDEKLPIYSNVTGLQNALQLYTSANTTLFNCPETGVPYIVNRSLSGQSLALFPSPMTVKVIQDARPHPNGDITTSFLDGHAVQLGQ